MTLLCSLPPRSWQTGKPSALPFKSHNAMSTALTPKAAIPSGPYHQIRSNILCQSRSTSIASSPISKGANPCSIMSFVASDASLNWDMHSPQPTSPSAVSTWARVMYRSIPYVVGFGVGKWKCLNVLNLHRSFTLTFSTVVFIIPQRCTVWNTGLMRKQAPASMKHGELVVCIQSPTSLGNGCSAHWP